MLRWLKPFKRWATYQLVRGCTFVFNWIPRRLAVFLGGWIGLAVWRLSPRAQHRIARHLTLVYGDRMTSREKTSIGRRFCVNSGRNLADILRFRKHFQCQILPLIDAEGMEHFDAACRKGKGVFGVTGHIGNFELLAAYVQSRGYEVAVIGREMYDRRLDRLLIQNREAVGLTNIATTESPKRLIDWLRHGRVVGVLIDIDSSRVRGMFIPVFGRWAHTPIGQTILGLRCGSEFVPTACVRTDENRYRVIARPAVKVEPSGDFNRDVYNVTLECTRALEAIIREYPDQWPWHQSRWRTPRPGAT